MEMLTWESENHRMRKMNPWQNGISLIYYKLKQAQKSPEPKGIEVHPSKIQKACSYITKFKVSEI